jgi:glyoxylase-like metal-dependent hydrolase (beta-lactamase superfamily II)
MKVIEGIYQFNIPIPDNPLGHLNSYLLEGTDGWLMIDTGWFTSDAFASLETQLQEIGLKLRDIRTIIVTHVHPDHFGLAGRIKQLSPHTELITHRWESDLIESRYIKFSELQDKMATLMKRHGVPESLLPSLKSASMPTLNFVTVTLPDRCLYGGEIISTGKFELEIIVTPGHSPGHICLYEQEKRLLFAGDHILPVITPNISYHVQSGDNPLGDYLNALRKIQFLSVDKVLPAHQHIFTDLPGRIKEIIQHHDDRKNEIKAIISNKPETAYEIASKLVWKTPELNWERFSDHLKRAAVTETLAHLECMRWEGYVQRIARDDTVVYRALS